MRHPAIGCPAPVRGRWGGPPDGNSEPTLAAAKLAFAPRGQLDLATVIQRDLTEIGVQRAGKAPPEPPPGGRKFATPPGKKLQGLGFGVFGLVLLGAVLLVCRRGRS
ncbi:MAG TPA: hypothetical protein VGD37_28215 [Kofleriaceae bacterium]|jgi:hypothetical protein